MRALRMTRPRGGKKDEDGIVLIVALLVVAVLMAVTLQFTYTTTIDLKLVRNQSREIQMYYAARGAVALAKALLREDLAGDPGEKSVDTVFDAWAGSAVGGDLDPSGSEGGTHERSIGEISLEYRIMDEDRKICLNNLVVKEVTIPQDEDPPPDRPIDAGGKKEEAPDPKALAEERKAKTREFIRDVLTQAPFHVEEEEAKEIVEAIAENAPYASIEDLAFIEGITQEMLFGFDDEFDSHPGLVVFFTVHSMGQINLNTAPREVLIAILKPKYGVQQAEYFADEVLAFRAPPVEEMPLPGKDDRPGGGDGQDEPQGGVFKTVGDLATEIAGLEDVFGGTDDDEKQKKKGKALKNQLTVRSRFFSVKVTTGDTAPRKEFSFLLKRGKTGGDPIPVLLWEERERPPLDEEEEFP